MTDPFPPPSCTAWEDCKHDGVCHDPAECGAIGPNARCPYCDGTGDVHRADGEWLGACDCGAAS